MKAAASARQEITSPRTNAPAMKVTMSARQNMTLPRTKYPRERTIAVTNRPPRLKRHSALRMKMTSLMIYKIRKTFQTQAQILPCPEYQKMEIQMKIRALEEGNTIFDLTLPPTLLMNTDTSQKI